MLIAKDYRGTVTARPDAGIGIVGVGGIVRHAHVPAYLAAGLGIAGVCGRRIEPTQALASEFGVAFATTDFRDLIARPDVKVIDLAIPGEGRMEIIAEAVAAGKPILAQKPLANTYAEALEMVTMCERAGVPLAVNQNARWAPAYRAAKVLIDTGALGDIYDITHEMRNNQDSSSWFHDAWYAKEARFQIAQYSVHHIDLMRFWTGREPVRVIASESRKPGQFSRGEMMADIILRFDDNLRCLIVDRNACLAERDVAVRFEVSGTDGALIGDPLTSRLTLIQAGIEPSRLKLDGSWFPDSFAFVMDEFLTAIERGAEPACSGRDNLGTLAIVEAAYASIEGPPTRL